MDKTIDEITVEVAQTCRATQARIDARRLTRLYDRALAAHGVRSTEYAVLIAVGHLGNGLLGDMAAKLAMDVSTASRAVASLARKGLLKVDVRGHRTRHVSLTTEGAALVQAAYPDWLRAQRA